MEVKQKWVSPKTKKAVMGNVSDKRNAEEGKQKERKLKERWNEREKEWWKNQTLDSKSRVLRRGNAGGGWKRRGEKGVVKRIEDCIH